MKREKNPPVCDATRQNARVEKIRGDYKW